MTRYRPTYLSVSAVQLYCRCPLQYRLRYVDKLAQPTNAAMEFGKAFHKALEAEHRGDNSERALVAAYNISQAILDAANLGIMPSKAHALTLLDEYKARGLGGKIGVPERKFVVPFPSPKIPVPLLGYIDLVVPEQRELRDFKTTSTTTWTPAKVALESQLHAYGFAYQRLYRHRADKALWVIFSTVTPTIDVIEAEPSPDGFRLFEIEAEKVWQAVTRGEFPPCGTCETCNPSAALPQTGPTLELD